MAGRVKTTLAITGCGVAVGLAAVVVGIVNSSCEKTAEAQGESIEQRRAKLVAEARAERERFRTQQQQWDRRFDAATVERTRFVPPVLVERPRKQTRNVRRWTWESPSETRARIWNIPSTDDAASTATGLLRICMSEADGSEADCIGIWQVLNNIRSSGCDRQRIRRITECDENGETLLSVMRRAQKYALGVMPARSRRTQWISELELGCEQPGSFPGSERDWRHQYGRSCPSTAALAKSLVAGEEFEPVFRGAQPITWGGRCETRTGACDDPLACQRGLARIQNEATHNAFWCRPGSRGCSSTIDPICLGLGHGRQSTEDETLDGVLEMIEVGAT